LVFNQLKNQPFYSYVVHVYEESKLWHERLGHLNYGKMKMLSKMVLGLPSIPSTKGVYEVCVLGKDHMEMFEKGKGKYVLKDIKHNFKVVSSSPIDRFI